jgi:hypothetical protein
MAFLVGEFTQSEQYYADQSLLNSNNSSVFDGTNFHFVQYFERPFGGPPYIISTVTLVSVTIMDTIPPQGPTVEFDNNRDRLAAYVFQANGYFGPLPIGSVLYSNEPPPPPPPPLDTVSVSGPTAPVLEGNTAQFTITLSQASTTPVTVSYTTADGSAVAGTDYTGTSGSVTFAPGQTSATVPVPTLYDATGDNSKTPPDQNGTSETFELQLTSASGATIATATATASIDECLLFTTGADTVDFNNLTSGKIAAINGNADLYNALGGNDVVTLPNVANYQLTPSVTWNPSQTFTIGALTDTSANTDTVTGGDGNDKIAIIGPATVNLTINGNGHSRIAPGAGTLNATISGGGKVELTSTTMPISGSIAFAPGVNETLQIDGTTMPTSTIYGFGPGETIDLAGVP